MIDGRRVAAEVRAATGGVHRRAAVTLYVVLLAVVGVGKGAEESMLMTSGVGGSATVDLASERKAVTMAGRIMKFNTCDGQ